MACCQRLLIDNGADVKTLCHLYIVQILYHGDRLAHTHSLGSQTGKDVGLGIVCECNKGLRILNAFVLQKTQITAITMDNHRINFVEKLVKTLATLLINFYDFDIHIFGSSQCYTHRGLAASHNDYVLHVGIVLLAGNLMDIWNVLTCSHKVSNIVDA